MAKYVSVILFGILFFLVGAFAQEAAPVVQAEAPKALGFLEKLVNGVSSIPAWAAAVVVFFLELIMRVWPTVKPKSLLLFMSYMFKLLEKLFEKSSEFLDKVVQNLKDK